MSKLHISSSQIWRSIVSLVMVVAIFSTFFCITASAATNVHVTYTGTDYNNGQIVDTFNGVPAKYTTASSDTGVFSCAGYVKAYYTANFQVTVNNLVTGGTPSSTRGTFQATMTPMPGDVGYQLNSSGSGHWFIIKSVSGSGVDKTCTIIEQNWKWSQNGEIYCSINRTVDYSTKGINYFHLN